MSVGPQYRWQIVKGLEPGSDLINVMIKKNQCSFLIIIIILKHVAIIFYHTEENVLSLIVLVVLKYNR